MARNYKKFSPFQFRLKEPLGKPECPYAYRWVFNFSLFSIRIHKWIRSDDKRFFHDHPWGFLTIVLRGGYTDVSPDHNDPTGVSRDVLSKGSIRYRASHHQHYVEVTESGALTLLFVGPKIREWGFWVKGKLKRPLRYFGKFGHPPCDEQ